MIDPLHRPAGASSPERAMNLMSGDTHSGSAARRGAGVNAAVDVILTDPVAVTADFGVSPPAVGASGDADAPPDPSAAARERFSVGCYKVADQDGGTFLVLPDASQDGSLAPADQQELYADVRKTLQVLHGLGGNERGRLTAYYACLRAVAETGLVGASVQPAFAHEALRRLQTEIVEQEAVLVKTGYMTWLARITAYVAAPALVVALVAPVTQRFTWLNATNGLLTRGHVTCLSLLVAGCAVGVWLSFGARKTTLTFDDLRVLEKDYLGPKTRIGFAELLTLTLGLLFAARVVVVDLGVINTANVFTSPLTALIVGLLCGFSEQALSSQIAKRAKGLFQE